MVCVRLVQGALADPMALCLWLLYYDIILYSSCHSSHLSMPHSHPCVWRDRNFSWITWKPEWDGFCAWICTSLFSHLINEAHCARMRSPSSAPATARHRSEGQRVKSEGGWQNGNCDTGMRGQGAGGGGAWMESISMRVCYYSWHSWKRHTLSKMYTVMLWKREWWNHRPGKQRMSFSSFE